jgi:hypothetical protein
MVWAPDSPDVWAPDSGTPNRWASDSSGLADAGPGGRAVPGRQGGRRRVAADDRVVSHDRGSAGALAGR